MVHATTAACTVPTACVLVIATGPAKVPDSSIQDTPVISPLPFWEKKPAATGWPGLAARMDRGHAGSDGLALDQRGIPDLDARHVGNRVPPARPPAERYPDGAGARLARRGDGMRIDLTRRIHGLGLHPITQSH